MVEANQVSTILIVDDNEMNRDLLMGVLDDARYKPLTAADGATALRMIQQFKIDLVLLDISMPGMSGYEVCEQLKADKATADIPVIFISALDQTSHIVRGFEVGGGDYVTKPFKFREVIARVDGQLTMYWQKRKIEEMIERERQHHRTLDEMRKQFIGSATHDLKNPILIISGYADMLERQQFIQENERAVSYIAAIRRGVGKMNSLVQDMLELLQLEHGVELEKSNYVFTVFVRECVEDMMLRAQEKEVGFTLDLPDDKSIIAIDTKRISRVIDNLVSNAIKYTPAGGEVRVLAGITAESAWFEVADTGLGIPQEVLPNLFNPFQRVELEEHMAQEGTGLGLSIVKAVVEQHNGTIHVQSSLGQGSTFRVELPRTSAKS